MTTLTALYCGEEDGDHLEDDGPGHGQLGPAFLVFFASYRLKRRILVLEGIKAAAEADGHGPASLRLRDRKSRTLLL